MQTLKKEEWTEVSWRNSVYNANFSVDTRLEHGFAIEYTYFQLLPLFVRYCHIVTPVCTLLFVSDNRFIFFVIDDETQLSRDCYQAKSTSIAT